jgi:hypothetical protein
MIIIEMENRLVVEVEKDGMFSKWTAQGVCSHSTVLHLDFGSSGFVTALYMKGK